MNEPWIWALLVGVASLLVYLRTMCRTIYVGDSGELAAAVQVLGIGHPPGYPLYVLLGKLFSLLLPVGKPALRLNIFSAICASASAVFLYFTLRELTFVPRLAAGVALTWAFSASLWSQAGIARVYALGACVSSLATWFFVKWYVHPEQTQWLLSAALVIGIGLGNHPVVGAHLPAIALGVLLQRPQTFVDLKLWLLGAACVLAPIVLLYLVWIPLRARTRPVVNWGNIRNFTDLKRFLSRKDYWRHRWVHSIDDAIAVLGFYLRRVGVEYSFLGSAAIAVGIPILILVHPAIAAMVGVLVLLNTASMIAHARREDIFHWTRYMITAWFALALPLGFGWAYMLSAFPESVRPFIAFAPAAVLLVVQFRRQDLSRHRYADEYNRRILECLPENATLIAQDDNVVFPLMYLKYAEGLRADVKLLEQGVHQLAELRFNPRTQAVYCTHWQGAFNTPATPRGPGLRLVDEGLIYRIVSTDMNYRARDLWDKHLLAEMEDPRIPRNYLTRCLLGHVYFMHAEWEVKRDPVSAVAWYQRSATMACDSAVQQYNLGLAYERQGWKKLSEDAFTRAEQIDPAYRRSRSPEPTARPTSQPAPPGGVVA